MGHCDYDPISQVRKSKAFSYSRKTPALGFAQLTGTQVVRCYWEARSSPISLMTGP